MKNLKNKKGFTIVELVIVIAVIAILAAVLIPTFSGIIQKAEASADMQEARNAYTQYIASATTIEDVKYVKVGTVYYKVNDWDTTGDPAANEKYLEKNATTGAYEVKTMGGQQVVAHTCTPCPEDNCGLCTDSECDKGEAAKCPGHTLEPEQPELPTEGEGENGQE